MEKIIITDIPSEAAEFFAMEESVGKNIVYNDKFKMFTYELANILITDDHIYFAATTYRITRGVKYYPKQISRQGFTYTNKKVEFWFGSAIPKFVHYLPRVFEAVKIDWIPANYDTWLTKTLFAKILSGAITNPEDLCKAILKSNRCKASHSLLKKCIVNNCIQKHQLLRTNSIAANLDHWLSYKFDTNAKFNHLMDLEDQARTLNKKIDYTWSVKRMEKEHKEWTMEIMEHKLPFIQDTPVPDVDKYPVAPAEFTLLTNEKDVFKEGIIMKHCIYTNYWHSILNGAYLVYHIIIDGIEATLGINKSYDGKFTFNQIYSYGNTAVNQTIRERAIDWINKLNDSVGYKGQLQTVPPNINEPWNF